MDGPNLAERPLISVAMALHDASERVDDIRELRERAQLALHDVDPALVEDLLVSAAGAFIGLAPDDGALTELWGDPQLTAAAHRLQKTLMVIATED